MEGSIRKGGEEAPPVPTVEAKQTTCLGPLVYLLDLLSIRVAH